MSGLETDEAMRALYLGLLGTALLVVLFAQYRNRLGTALQHAAIWVLIFLGAILAYGFKDQIASQLMPGVAREGPEGAIRLARSADGHFHARLEVNGTPVEFLVDTGASDMVLARQDAEAAGIDLSRLVYTGAAMTANGIVQVAPVRLDRVEFAGRTERGVPAVVTDGEMPISLLGMRYLDRFAEFSVRGDTMVIRR